MALIFQTVRVFAAEADWKLIFMSMNTIEHCLSVDKR